MSPAWSVDFMLKLTDIQTETSKTTIVGLVQRQDSLQNWGRHNRV